MKYIRTKDGKIVDIEDWSYFKNNYFIEKNDIIISKHSIFKVDKIYIDEVDIIKQADNIPELCDLFIIDLKGHCTDAEYDSFRLYEDFKEMYLKWKEDYPDIVGCGSIIARDKNGCIAILPVAKANDEGELELL